jgi:hypothetical protein
MKCKNSDQQGKLKVNDLKANVLFAFVAVYCGVVFSTATKLRHFSLGTKKPVALLS